MVLKKNEFLILLQLQKILVKKLYKILTKNEWIFLEKTKNYYEFLKRDLVYKETKKTKNLVISKDGIRAEFIFFME